MDYSSDDALDDCLKYLLIFTCALGTLVCFAYIVVICRGTCFYCVADSDAYGVVRAENELLARRMSWLAHDMEEGQTLVEEEEQREEGEREKVWLQDEQGCWVPSKEYGTLSW